jgi:hypothetical protein
MRESAELSWFTVKMCENIQGETTETKMETESEMIWNDMAPC